jgi:hypothetical protein
MPARAAKAPLQSAHYYYASPIPAASDVPVCKAIWPRFGFDIA